MLISALILGSILCLQSGARGEDSSCPCLTTDNGLLDIYRDGSGDLIYAGYTYPTDYGVGCGQHDLDLDPYCSSDDAPEWCTDQFCWVDPDNCDSLEYLSGYFPASGLYYSFQTCGSDGTFYDWFNDGSTDDDRPLTDLADLVENYLLTIRSSLQGDFSEFSSVSSACDSYPSCGCAECVYNSNWLESVDFSQASLTPNAVTSLTDTSTCLAETASGYYLKVVGAEYQSTANVGFVYSGFQDDGAFSQWPALEWCPTDYDPRFRPWYAAAVTNPKLLIIVIDISGSMAGSRIGLAADAAKAILKTLSWKDRVGIVLFNSIVANVRQPEFVTDAERDLINTWIDTNVFAGGGTSFYEPMLEALDMIDADPGCSNVVLFLTDGEASFTEDNYNTVASRVQTNDVVLFTYALGSGADSTIMKRIACDNDGLFYAVSDNADLGSVMSSYYAYYAASISNTGVRWANFLEAATGTDIYAACTPLYDTTDASSEVSVIFGVSCIDINVVANMDDLKARAGWSDMLAYFEERAEVCIAPWNGYTNAAIVSALEYIRHKERQLGAETCDDNYVPPNGGDDDDDVGGGGGGNDDTDDDADSSSGGSIAGIIVGILIPVGCIASIVFYCVHVNKRKNDGAVQPSVVMVASQTPQPATQQQQQPQIVHAHAVPQQPQQHTQQQQQQPQQYIQLQQHAKPFDTNNKGLYVAQ